MPAHAYPRALQERHDRMRRNRQRRAAEAARRSAQAARPSQLAGMIRASTVAATAFAAILGLAGPSVARDHAYRAPRRPADGKVHQSLARRRT